MSNTLQRVTLDPHVVFVEKISAGLASSALTSKWPLAAALIEFTNGTGDNQVDKVFHVAAGSVVAASPVTYDLAGSLVNPVDGSAVVLVEVAVLCVKNTSAKGSGSLKVGGGSAQFVTPFGATGDLVNVRPGGVLILAAPYDGGGYGVTATTADVLTIDSTSGTCAFELLILGRSA